MAVDPSGDDIGIDPPQVQGDQDRSPHDHEEEQPAPCPCPVSSRKEQAQEEDEQRPADAEEQAATVGRFRLVARHVQQILPRPVAVHADGSNSTIPSAFARQPRARSVQSKCQLALSFNPSPRVTPAGFLSLQIKRCGLDSRDCPSRMLQPADPFHGPPLEIGSPDSRTPAVATKVIRPATVMPRPTRQTPPQPARPQPHAPPQEPSAPPTK